MTAKPTARKRLNVPWTDTPFQRHAKMAKRIELETRAKTTAIHEKLSLRIKLTRLVAQWREQATWLCGTERYDTIATLRRCAHQLERILKP